MATTDWSMAADQQERAPHTYCALQHLVMAMSDVVKKKGKKTLFGRDRGLAAYKTFEQKLRDTILALVLDGLVTRSADSGEVREAICAAVEGFSDAYPNWQDAYGFADHYFSDHKQAAEEQIQVLMVSVE